MIECCAGRWLLQRPQVLPFDRRRQYTLGMLLVLDPAIRDWVVLPMVAIMVLMGICAPSESTSGFPMRLVGHCTDVALL